MKKKLFSPGERNELLSLLKTGFGPYRYFARNGGQLAVRCPSKKCPSNRDASKLKMEFHIPTGLYSCWVCGWKGVLHAEDPLARCARNQEDLKSWLERHAPRIKDLVKAPLGSAGLTSAQWRIIMMEALREFKSEGSEASGHLGERYGGRINGGGDFISVEDLPPEKLLDVGIKLPGLKGKSSTETWREKGWNHWIRRWGSQGKTKQPLREASRLDVRIKPMGGGKVALAFPAWDVNGNLRGILWWYPDYMESRAELEAKLAERKTGERQGGNQEGDLESSSAERIFKPMPYRIQGDKANMILAEHSLEALQRRLPSGNVSPEVCASGRDASRCAPKSRIILVEGVWDALRAGRDATPIFGSFLPKGSRLWKVLSKSRPDEIIVALDSDASDKAWKLAKSLSHAGHNVRVAIPPKGKDPADMDAPLDEWAEPVKFAWAKMLEERLGAS